MIQYMITTMLDVVLLITHVELVMWRARRRMVLPANGLSCDRLLGWGGGRGGLKLRIMICRTAYVIVYYYYQV